MKQATWTPPLQWYEDPTVLKTLPEWKQKLATVARRIENIYLPGFDPPPTQPLPPAAAQRAAKKKRADPNEYTWIDEGLQILKESGSLKYPPPAGVDISVQMSWVWLRGWIDHETLKALGYDSFFMCGVNMVYLPCLIVAKPFLARVNESLGGKSRKKEFTAPFPYKMRYSENWANYLWSVHPTEHEPFRLWDASQTSRVDGLFSQWLAGQLQLFSLKFMGFPPPHTNNLLNLLIPRNIDGLIRAKIEKGWGIFDEAQQVQCFL